MSVSHSPTGLCPKCYTNRMQMGFYLIAISINEILLLNHMEVAEHLDLESNTIRLLGASFYPTFCLFIYFRAW